MFLTKYDALAVGGVHSKFLIYYQYISIKYALNVRIKDSILLMPKIIVITFNVLQNVLTFNIAYIECMSTMTWGSDILFCIWKRDALDLINTVLTISSYTELYTFNCLAINGKFLNKEV